MSKYGIVVKKGIAQYSISSDNKDFITEHVAMVFKYLKQKPEVLFNDGFVKLNAVNIGAVPETKTEKPKPSIENTSLEPLTEDIENIPDEAVASEHELAEEHSDTFEQAEINAQERIVEETSEFSFENILENKIQNAPLGEDAPTDASFDYESIIKMKQPETLIDYLIITAYYMLENEGVETFQLKQLNARLYKSMKMVVDRKTMQKAVEEGLLDIISDISDTDGIIEYAITDKGKEFYINGGA